MNAVDLKALIERMPDAPVSVVLEELARLDPVLWCMTYRRLRGQPLIFDNSKQLSGESLSAVAKKMESVNYQQELQGRLLRHRPFIIQPMRDQHPHKVYEKARQIGISETSLNEVIHFLWKNPGTKWVITLPRDSQLRDFSTTRIAEAFAETPQMRSLLGVPNQVYAKRVGDSFMLLRSAWEAGLGEGIDADGVTLDEKDRMKEKIEVAFRESMKSSKFGWLREISTPTIPGAGIDAVFKESDQQVWLVRCKTCNLEQEIEYPDNIVVVKDIPAGTKELPEGCYAYLCRKTKCRGDLDRMRGRWVPRRPEKKNIRGYHMPQSIAPWISATRLMQNKIDYRWQSLWVNYCVFTNTYITTRNGAKLAAGIEIGDQVLSHDGTFNKVIELKHRHFTGMRVDLFTDGEAPDLQVTSGHPLYAIPQTKMAREVQPSWIDADALTAGDWLVQRSATTGGARYVKLGRVEQVEVFNEPVFNYEIENTHSYVSNGFVSHNCLAKPSSSEGILLTDTDFEMANAGHQFITRKTKDWMDISVGIDWGFLNWVVVMARNVHNQRLYILNLGIFEDKHGDELAAVKAVESFIAPYEPDIIIADAGYGKDRNAYLLRKFSPRGEGRFFSCWYNPSTKGSRTFVPQWSTPEQARVLVDRTMSIKGICRAIREREFGLPDITNDRVQLFRSHFKALAPVMTEEDGEIYEEIKATGDDHFAHACVYSFLGMEQINKRGNFSFSFE